MLFLYAICIIRETICRMKPFSTTNAVYKSVVSAHNIHKKSTHTHIVLYESHEPIVECFGISSDSMSVNDTELTKYADLQEDMNIHNMPENKSLVLYDTLYIEYIHDFIYVDHAKSKDFVYNMNTTLARKMNKQKFHDNYRHTQMTVNVYHVSSTKHMDATVSSVASFMTESPVNIFNVARGVFGYVVSERQSVIDVYNKLKDVSFVFNINGYKLKTHNINAIRFDAQRILEGQSVRAMCIQISLTDSKDKGYIEYTNIHNGTHYTHNTKDNMHDDKYNYDRSLMLIHEDILNVISGDFDTPNESTQSMTTQHTVLPIQSTVLPVQSMTTQHIVLPMQNITTQSTVSDAYINFTDTSVTTQKTYMHNTSTNIAVLSSLFALGAVMIGAMLCAILFRPIQRCVRTLCGMTNLCTENDDDHISLDTLNTMLSDDNHEEQY